MMQIASIYGFNALKLDLHRETAGCIERLYSHVCISVAIICCDASLTPQRDPERPS